MGTAAVPTCEPWCPRVGRWRTEQTWKVRLLTGSRLREQHRLGTVSAKAAHDGIVACDVYEFAMATPSNKSKTLVKNHGFCSFQHHAQSACIRYPRLIPTILQCVPLAVCKAYDVTVQRGTRHGWNLPSCAKVPASDGEWMVSPPVADLLRHSIPAPYTIQSMAVRPRRSLQCRITDSPPVWTRLRCRGRKRYVGVGAAAGSHVGGRAGGV